MIIKVWTAEPDDPIVIEFDNGERPLVVDGDGSSYQIPNIDWEDAQRFYNLAFDREQRADGAS